jgi:hypothetical protein
VVTVVTWYTIFHLQGVRNYLYWSPVTSHIGPWATFLNFYLLHTGRKNSWSGRRLAVSAQAHSACVIANLMIEEIMRLL